MYPYRPNIIEKFDETTSTSLPSIPNSKAYTISIKNVITQNIIFNGGFFVDINSKKVIYFYDNLAPSINLIIDSYNMIDQYINWPITSNGTYNDEIMPFVSPGINIIGNINGKPVIQDQWNGYESTYFTLEIGYNRRTGIYNSSLVGKNHFNTFNRSLNVIYTIYPPPPPPPTRPPPPPPPSPPPPPPPSPSTAFLVLTPNLSPDPISSPISSPILPPTAPPTAPPPPPKFYNIIITNTDTNNIIFRGGFTVNNTSNVIYFYNQSDPIKNLLVNLNGTFNNIDNPFINGITLVKGTIPDDIWNGFNYTHCVVSTFNLSAYDIKSGNLRTSNIKCNVESILQPIPLEPSNQSIIKYNTNAGGTYNIVGTLNTYDVYTQLPGSYKIYVNGGGGGSSLSQGGMGAYISTVFANLPANLHIRIIIGGRGADGYFSGSGGGGLTQVFTPDDNGTTINIIAGGGGGGGWTLRCTGGDAGYEGSNSWSGDGDNLCVPNNLNYPGLHASSQSGGNGFYGGNGGSNGQNGMDGFNGNGGGGGSGSNNGLTGIGGKGDIGTLNIPLGKNAGGLNGGGDGGIYGGGGGGGLNGGGGGYGNVNSITGGGAGSSIVNGTTDYTISKTVYSTNGSVIIIPPRPIVIPVVTQAPFSGKISILPSVNSSMSILPSVNSSMSIVPSFNSSMTIVPSVPVSTSSILVKSLPNMKSSIIPQINSSTSLQTLTTTNSIQNNNNILGMKPLIFYSIVLVSIIVCIILLKFTSLMSIIF